MGARNLNSGATRRTRLGLALEQSAKEILARVKGEARLARPPKTRRNNPGVPVGYREET